MKRVDTPWSESESALLTKLWTEGLSGSECAKQIGTGRSRNAAIARVHRLGLAQRASPARPVKSSVRAKSCAPRKAIITPKSSPPARSRTLWKAGPPKLSAKPVRVDPNSPASLAAAAILLDAKRAEARRAVYRERTL